MHSALINWVCCREFEILTINLMVIARLRKGCTVCLLFSGFS